MRELVLELAVRGRLVSNGTKPDKDPAWIKFCSESAKPTDELEPAFKLPKHWRWVRLEAVAAPCGQKKPDTKFTYVDVGAIDNLRGIIKEDVEVIAPENAPSRARKLVSQNSVIYSTVRPYLKNIAIVDRKFSPPAIVSTAFAVLHPKDFLDHQYLYHWLRSRPFQTDVESKMKGVAYPAISDSEFWQCLIPVPPPAEQRRIVAKVDELMALCDELEQRQQSVHDARQRLTQSTYHHVTAAKDPAEFRHRFHFILQHSAFILDEVPQLRQAILQLAVQGRLVPQNPKEGDGRKVVEQILKQRGLKLSANTTDEFPGLPKFWAAISGEDIFEVAGGIQKTPLRAPRENAFPYLRVANVQRGRLVLDDVQKFELGDGELERWRLQPNDPSLSKATGVRMR